MSRFLVFFLFLAKSLADPVVETPLGKITGIAQIVQHTRIESFLGIPYAKPPVGNLRFNYPQPYDTVKDLEATQYGNSCPQPILFPSQKFSNVTSSEDCLSLNVFRKTGTRKDDRKAVLVYIHGGAYLFGNSADLDSNMAPLAAVEDIITVSVNYRLNFLGFGYFKNGSLGNFGLFDQRLALEWVQNNIEAFGGDPDRVTIIGVSAGSMSVSAQILTPLNQNTTLFHGAVMDAGVAAGLFIKDPARAYGKTRCVAKALGCSEEKDLIQCLRKVDVWELLNRTLDTVCDEPYLTFVPTVDGTFFPTDVEEYLENHAADLPKVRTLIGYGRNEGSVFVTLDQTFPTIVTGDQFADYCSRIAEHNDYRMDLKHDSQLRQKVIDRYWKSYSPPFHAADYFMGDGTFLCPCNVFIKRYSQVNEQVYVYRFERAMRGTYMSVDPKIFGVYHTTGFLMFTGTMLEAPPEAAQPDPSDIVFMYDAMKMLAGFVRSNDAPSIRGNRWPNFSKGEGVLVVNEKSHVRSTLPHEKNCESVFPYYG